MASQGQVTKIYSLQTLGFNDIHKQLQQVADDFAAIKKAKRDAEAAATTATSREEVQKYKDEVNKLKIAEQELRVQRQQMINEAKAEQIARQASINQSKEQKNANKAEAGSYQEVYNQYKQLYALVKPKSRDNPISFQGQTLNYDEAIQKLKSLAAAEQAFRRQFAADKTLVGEYTTGIVQAFKNMGLGDLVGGQITKVKDRLSGLNGEFEHLKKEFHDVKATGVGDLSAIEQKMISNRKEAIALEAEVGKLKTEFRGAGDIGNQIGTSISKGFKEAKGQMASLLISYLSFQAVLSQGQKFIHENAELSDSFADLRIRIHGTEEDVNRLVESLKKINTRTSLQGLVDIAAVVSKKGVSPDQIVGITQALDQLFVVLGKEAGDPHEATASIVKLISIFNEDKHVTAERVTEIGSAITKLSTSGVATGKYLIDFAERVGSVRGITGLTLPNILGMGAALQQLGQRSEVAGTAAVQLTTKMFGNVPKFAEAAGKSVEEFKKLLKDNPFDALVAVAENLKGSGKDFEEVVQAFGEVGITGARIKTVLADIATNGDYVKDRMKAAGTAIGDSGSVAQAAAIKQNTFAATLDNIKKKFELLGTSRGFQVTLAAIASALSLVLANIIPIIGALALYGIGWLTVTKEMEVAGVVTQVTNGQLLLQRVQLIANNVILGVQRILLGAATIAQLGYALAIAVFTRNAILARFAATELGAAIRANPIGIFLTLLGLVAGVMTAFAKSTIQGAEALKEHAYRLQAMNAIHSKATELIGDQISKLDAWVVAIKSATTSADTKLAIMHKMIEAYPQLSSALKGEVIDLQELEKAYGEVTKQIRLKAETEASAQLTAEKQKNLLVATTLRQRIEAYAAPIKGEGKLGHTEDYGFQQNQLTKDEISLLRTLPGVSRDPGFYGSQDTYTIGKSKADINNVLDELKKKEGAFTAEYQAYLNLQAANQAKLTQLEEDTKKKQVETNKKLAETSSLSIIELRKLIDDVDKEYDTLKEGNPRLLVLQKERDAYQKRLDALNGKETKEKKYSGAKLSGDQKDYLRDVDAQKDELLANEKLKFEKSEENEEAYLRNILKINQDAIDKKLKFIKGANAEERKVIAELHLERVQKEKETFDKIFSMSQTDLKKKLDQDIQAAKDEAQQVHDDPNASASAKAQAKLDADKKILALQEKFNKDIDALEKVLGQQSKKNVKDNDKEIHDLKQAVHKDELELDKAALKDAQDAGERDLAKFKRIMAEQRLAIIESTKPQSKKDEALKELGKQEDFGILAREVASMRIQLPLYKHLLETKQITDKDYDEFMTKLLEKQAKLRDTQEKGIEKTITRYNSLQDLIKGKLSGLFGFDDGSEAGKEKEKQLGEAISQSYSLAMDSMHAFYDAERQRIQENLQLQLDRLDREKDQVVARAQSQAEIASIEKQYAAKKKAEEDKAHEQIKKSKRAEANIAFATELANIWSTVWSLGPIAGPIAGVIFSGLALARHSIALSQINREKFEQGGMPGKGGIIGGKPHSEGGTPFAFKGRQYEAEAKELAIVRTKNADPNKVFSVTGTQMQIASAINQFGGGRAFAPGASLTKFDYGGSLGETLQAPVFVPSTSNTVVQHGGGISEEKFKEMMKRVEDLTVATNSRIDNIQVVQVTHTVTEAQKKQVKQNSIGVL